MILTLKQKVGGEDLEREARVHRIPNEGNTLRLFSGNDYEVEDVIHPVESPKTLSVTREPPIVRLSPAEREPWMQDGG